MVYYLKYRPKTLSELDNIQVSQLMSKYLSRSHVPHAFLFTGPKGTGKTSTARIVAKSINCTLSKVKGQACGLCENCVSIALGNNLDVLEIDAASNRGIDEIRDLREKIKLTPTNLEYKVYIIDEVHMLTTEAFNALLKTLEEPPAHAVFILATTESHKVPDTILSRCVRIDFQKAALDEIVASLKRIVGGEKLTVSQEALLAIANAADGSFRDAAKILEELVLEGTKVELTEVLEKVSTVDAVVIETFLKNLGAKNASLLLQSIQTLASDGKNVRQFFLQVTKKLEELLVNSYSQKIDWERKEIMQALRLFSASFTDLKNAVVPTLPFELAVVEYCEGVTPKITLEKTTRPQNAPVNNLPPVEANPSPIADKWNQILDALKPYNHSLVGVLHSCQPLSIHDGLLSIEAAYKFHAERLSDPKVKNLLAKVVSDVLGLETKVEVVIRKR